MYVLCYLFDENELTNDELQKTSVETAQYSLHVVGLVVYNGIVMVADPNGVLRGGSNMEFLSMPLTPLESQPTTCVSRYDRDVKANEAAQAKANAQAALAMVVKARVKKAKAEKSYAKRALAMAKAQVKEAKAQAKSRVVGEEDQNAKAKKSKIDKA